MCFGCGVPWNCWSKDNKFQREGEGVARGTDSVCVDGDLTGGLQSKHWS